MSPPPSLSLCGDCLLCALCVTCAICVVSAAVGAIVRFRLLYFAEYILPGDVFLFREGRAKGKQPTALLSELLWFIACCTVGNYV